MPIPDFANSSGLFECHELESSAFLWAKGIRFIGIEPAPTPTNPQHVVFKFHDPDGQCQFELAAYDADAQVSAKQYALALRQLKDQIFRRNLR